MNLSTSDIQAFQTLCHDHGRKDMTESQAHESAVQLLEFLMLLIRSGDDKADESFTQVGRLELVRLALRLLFGILPIFRYTIHS